MRDCELSAWNFCCVMCAFAVFARCVLCVNAACAQVLNAIVDRCYRGTPYSLR